MRLKIVSFILLTMSCLLNCGLFRGTKEIQGDYINLDYTTAEKTLEWLEYINSDADYMDVQKFFMSEVASTKGCKAIIQFWDNREDWNIDQFYRYILESMDEFSGDPIYNADGTLTPKGKRVQLWVSALGNPNKYKEEIQNLKSLQLADKALSQVKQFLPEGMPIKCTIHVVLLGNLPFFTRDDIHGIDLLQLPNNRDETLDENHLIQVLSAMAYKSVFFQKSNETVRKIKKKDRINLVRYLTSQGAAYYFSKTISQDAKSDSIPGAETTENDHVWERMRNRLPELYLLAEQDIKLNLKGKISQKDILANWMTGELNPATVLGADMMAVIDEHLGREVAVKLISDFRRILRSYNQAAKKSNYTGEKRYLFHDGLAYWIASYIGK